MGGALPAARILALRTVASHPLWAAQLGGQVGVVDDDVPVAVVVAGRVGVGWGGYGVDVRLVGVVPVPAGQPHPSVVLDGDLDVIGVGVDPRCGERVGTRQRPGLGEVLAEGGAQIGDGGLVGLVRGRITARVVQHQRRGARISVRAPSALSRPRIIGHQLM
jgi:hypothetical protein